MNGSWQEKYKHTLPTLKPNKKYLKLNSLYLNDVDVEEFNKIYKYCKKHFFEVPQTKSRGISTKTKYRFKERYTIINGNQTFELVINCLEGDYRFVLKNKPNRENTIKGRKACQEIYKKADEYGIDFSKYAQGSAKTKEEILPPHIKFMLPERLLGKVLDNCHHLDLNAAYASKIAQEYPELKPMYEDIFSHRKENDGYYKHVLTNSIGCWQSEYCVDYNSRHKSAPYKYANLSKIAINGTRHEIERPCKDLKKAGRTPVLSNTDGIWYMGPIYHTQEEGWELGQWKNDHKYCKLLVRSKGAYQYLDYEGVCHSVVRGTSNLDILHERDDWKFGEIMNQDLSVEKYKFDKSKGVVKVWVKV